MLCHGYRWNNNIEGNCKCDKRLLFLDTNLSCDSKITKEKYLYKKYVLNVVENSFASPKELVCFLLTVNENYVTNDISFFALTFWDISYKFMFQLQQPFWSLCLLICVLFSPWSVPPILIYIFHGPDILFMFQHFVGCIFISHTKSFVD